ncbi:MAG: hypothetical protein V4574_20970 [Pseudomonadota bacterium]
MRHAALLIATALLAVTPAPAQTSQAWNDWVYRANSLLRAIASGQQSDVDIMCRDIHREMAGKGFPKWAQALTGVCEVLKEGMAKGRSGKFCRDSLRVAIQLEATSPVEDRRAPPLAAQLAEALQGLHDGLC